MFPTTLCLTFAKPHKSEMPGRLHVLPLQVKKRTQNRPVARKVLEAIWEMSRLQPESWYVANDVVIVQGELAAYRDAPLTISPVTSSYTNLSCSALVIWLGRQLRVGEITCTCNVYSATD